MTDDFEKFAAHAAPAIFVVLWSATEFILALAWLAVVLSIRSIGLLCWLIRRSV